MDWRVQNWQVADDVFYEDFLFELGLDEDLAYLLWSACVHVYVCRYECTHLCIFAFDNVIKIFILLAS